MNGKIFVIGGPTGSGESTITNEIIKIIPNFTRLVTATTREKRNGEEEGITYYYLTKEKFQEEIKSGNIIEYTHIENRDVYYGSYKPALEKKLNDGFNIIVNPDIIGAKYYKEKYWAKTIFIKPDSIDNLKIRIKKRNPDISPEELSKRIENAKNEIANEMSFYDFIVINEEGKLDEAVKKVAEIIRRNL